MYRTDWTRPSGYARWGWAWAVIAFLGGVPNIIGLSAEPSGLRWILLAFTLAMTALCLAIWRRGVRDDREHRAAMARMTGRLYGHGGAA